MTLDRNVGHHAAAAGVAAIALALLAGCGSSTTPATSAATSSASIPPTTEPTATRTPSAPQTPAQPTCPLTQAQVDQAFGQTLPGPKAPLNAYEVCVFGQTTPGNYHVVTIAVYNASTLASFGSTASDYFQSNRGSSAVTVPNLGEGAFIKGEDIWVETANGGIFVIGADFVVTNAALRDAAVAALPRV